MEVNKIHLKDYFSFLGENGCDPTLTTYIQYNMTEMKQENRKRPNLLICHTEQPIQFYLILNQLLSYPKIHI